MFIERWIGRGLFLMYDLIRCVEILEVGWARTLQLLAKPFPQLNDGLVCLFLRFTQYLLVDPRFESRLARHPAGIEGGQHRGVHRAYRDTPC